jgi:hypothetical protein
MRVKNAFCYALLLITACFMLACGSAPKRESARVVPQIDYDRYTGGCPQWQSYIQTRGVQDCGGKHHPGWFGATRCVIGSSGYTFTPRREKGWLGRTCYSVELPRNPNQFKVVSACTRIVDWVPTKAIGTSCQTNRQTWLDRIVQHEKYHVYQCESEVWKANQRWAQTSHRFEACAFREQGAFDDLNGKIQQALETEQQRVMQSIDAEFDVFHRTTAGQPIVTDCQSCESKR